MDSDVFGRNDTDKVSNEKSYYYAISSNVLLELQTFRTQDLSFPSTKGPYGELSFPRNESSLVPGNFRSHTCVRCFITEV